MSDLQDQVPDIIIGGDEFEKPVDPVDIDDEEDEEEEQQQSVTEEKPKKSVSFAGLGDGLTDAERAKKEFEEGGGLPEQPDNPDFTKLTPISPEIIGRQATINIGTIGHVAHGKSTVVKAISGVQTVRFKSELERNITIRLGYANAKIYRSTDPTCPRPDCYKSFPSGKEISPKCEVPGHEGRYELLRHVSFVDCFGLDTAFATPEGHDIINRDLRVGDKLLGPDGLPRTVLSMKEGEKELYEIGYFTNRTHSLEEDKFTCTGGHLLCLRIDTPVEAPCLDRNRNAYFVKQFIGNSEEMRSTNVMFTTMEEARAYYEAADKTPVEFEMTVESYMAAPESIRRKAHLYRSSALLFGAPKVDLTVGQASEEEVAWLVGLWLGDGDANSTRFTMHASADNEILARVTDIATKMGLATIFGGHSDSQAISVNLSTQFGSAQYMTEASNDLKENPFYLKLSELGVLDKNQVPSLLQQHTVSVRHALIAGLFDADGTYANGQFDLEFFASTGLKLFHSVVWTLRSLGFVVHTSRRISMAAGVEHQKLCMHFNGASAEDLPIASTSKMGSSLSHTWTTSEQFSVTPIGMGAFRGFEVDGDGRILLSDFMVAHNCPGHDILMSTMLSGAAVMDAALLLIAGNESCPQPQTSEHLAAIEIMKLKHIIILQNKVDLMREESALEHQKSILKFIKGTSADHAPIVPISAQLKYNIDAVNEFIVNKIPIPKRDFTASPRLIVIRSFDVNKPGAEIDELKGGVAGGSILSGVLKLGDEIEIRPGIVEKGEDGAVICRPIRSRIVTLFAENNDLKFAVPGGLIGVGTRVDPTLCRADRLVGQVLGHRGQLPEIYIELEVNYFLLRRLLGVKTEDGKNAKVEKLAKREIIMVNIGSSTAGAVVTNVKADMAKLTLTKPACTEIGEKIALSRRVGKHWRLIGWGSIIQGTTVNPVDY
ncbi:hypothetical protein D0Z03_000889 [Geotrichum reessii]|nr:hypothetical protein D0Z03_000889 [Galactomyces reessii]